MGITAKRLWYREINKKRGTKKGSEILKRKLRGSYTVEAAILMPLALGVILFVLSGVLFLHDRVWLECWVYGTAEQQAFRKEQREEENIAGLIMDSTGSVDVRGRSVQVNGAGTGRFLAALPRTLFFLKEPRMEVSVQVKRLYGEQVVRAWRKTADESGI
ncbi:MAG: hypothetical protein V8S96_00275 [Lachnospiraceae bacterium]